MPTGRAESDVVVVGAGIVGVSCAWQLQKLGLDVTLVDRLPPGEACSHGNAGVIATSSCIPLVMPGTWRNVPKWLLHRDGPIAFNVRDLPGLLGWLVQAQRAATDAGARRAGKALRALHGGAVDDHLAQAEGAGCADLIQRSEYLHVYSSEQTWAADRVAWDLRRELGVTMQELDRGQVRELEPALADRFPRGVLLDGHALALDPGRLVKALAEDFERRSGRRLQAEVRSLRPDAGGTVTLQTDEGDHATNHLVLAAGVWSAGLARQLGHEFPLVAERGYHVMYAEPGEYLRRPVMFAEEKVVASSMRAGLRLAGLAEFAAVDRPASRRRSATLERLAARCIPRLDRSQPDHWMGSRPSLPDSLPVIGRSDRHPGVTFAFGHGHTGLTASATTARIVAALVAGEAPPIDINAFSPGRFSATGGRTSAARGKGPDR